MTLPLLVEQKLEYSRIFDAFVRTDVIVRLLFCIVQAVELHTVDLFFLGFNHLGKLNSQLVEVVVHLVDFLASHFALFLVKSLIGIHVNLLLRLF